MAHPLSGVRPAGGRAHGDRRGQGDFARLGGEGGAVGIRTGGGAGAADGNLVRLAKVARCPKTAIADPAFHLGTGTLGFKADDSPPIEALQGTKVVGQTPFAVKRPARRAGGTSRQAAVSGADADPRGSALGVGQPMDARVDLAPYRSRLFLLPGLHRRFSLPVVCTGQFYLCVTKLLPSTQGRPIDSVWGDVYTD